MIKTAGEKKLNYGMIMSVYLFGIFMGALDTGIVTPARLIIQNDLGVGDKTGIWMITIYTLAYAASIPVMGKLADRFGRKIIYIISIILFGAGSLLCGLSQDIGSFGFLLAARVVQAVGGGGIVPVATAEFGTIFPKEKQGMALGLVGGVYGIANIFGASAGSAVLDIFGRNSWQLIFYINVPISIFIIIAGILFLPNTRVESVKKIDFSGIFILVLIIISLLYGLKNIDFFDLSNTMRQTDVFPFLLAVVILLPIFIIVEKRAEDPAMNLQYFRTLPIVITMVVAAISGMLLMGMVFVPQFSENAMMVPSGDGGYFVIALGLFAGVGAPLSGKLTDRVGPKLVLMFGFIVSIIGSLFLMFIAIPYPSYPTVLIALTLTGLGVGFTMGAPLNYMMLANTRKEESATALATLSLVRSIGTTIAPAIMVAFLAHAGSTLQSDVMDILPKEVSVPKLPYAKQLDDKLSEFKSDPSYSEEFADMDIPDLGDMTKVKIKAGKSDAKIPEDVLDLLKTSDVTNITKRTERFASEMFDIETPSVIKEINSGMQSGIDAIEGSEKELADKVSSMEKAVSGIDKGIMGMKKAVSGIREGSEGIEGAIAGQQKMLGMLKQLYGQISSAPAPAGGAGSFADITDMIPAYILDRIPENVISELRKIKTPEELKAKIDSTEKTIDILSAKKVQMDARAYAIEKNIRQTEAKRAGLLKAIDGMKKGLDEMDTTAFQMETLKEAIPGAFEKGKENYLQIIRERSERIESTYQSSLNKGFWQIYLTTSIFAALALLLLLAYRDNKRAN